MPNRATNRLPVVLNVMRTMLTLACLLLWPQPAQAAEGTATLYVYRPAEGSAVVGVIFSGQPRNKITVACDGVELARLPVGQYFAAKLPAGEHFVSDKKYQRGGIRFTVEPGQSYYMMAQWEGSLRNHPVLRMVQADQGRIDVQGLKPIEPGSISDRARVVSIPKPAQ